MDYFYKWHSIVSNKCDDNLWLVYPPISAATLCSPGLVGLSCRKKVSVFEYHYFANGKFAKISEMPLIIRFFLILQR